MLRRYGVLLALAAVLAVAAVAGWKGWAWQQGQQSARTATTFLDAMRKADGAGAAAQATDTPGRAEAAQLFAGVAGSGPEGYRTLARLREAALRAAANDPAALTIWDQIGSDSAADPVLRDLAALLWAQNQVDHGDPASVEAHLAGIVAPGNPWRPLGQETQALLALRTGQDARARDLFKQLNGDANAPQGVRARTGALLSRMGDTSVVPAGPAGGIGE